MASLLDDIQGFGLLLWIQLIALFPDVAKLQVEPRFQIGWFPNFGRLPVQARRQKGFS